MKFHHALAVAVALAVLIGTADAQTQSDATAIENAVLSNLSIRFGIHSKIIKHLNLSQPFQTKSRWSFVVAKQPDEESRVTDGIGSPIGQVSLCFVKDGAPDCSEELFLAKFQEQKADFSPGQAAFYDHFASDLVFSGPRRTHPLLWVQSCSNRGANGNCLVSTFLFAYDRKADKFVTIFFNMMGRNNNQETRFVESGPLHGHVVVAYPTQDPPYTYFVEVYRRSADLSYSRLLKYRGRTVYGDGNPLAVIDSEMPETLRRLGLWKMEDALPVPPSPPSGCTQLVLRNGVEWCEPR